MLITLFPFPRPHTANSYSRRAVVGGFTLIEVLVGAALSLIAVAAAGSVLVQHIRTTTVQSVQLRFQNDWGRVSNFIETEVGEGISVTADPNIGCGSNGAVRRFTITIPVIVNTDPNPVIRRISYNQVGNDLERCGPPIANDGRLNVASTTVQPDTPVIILRNATLNVNTINDRLVEYNLTLNDPTPPAFSQAFQRTYPDLNQFVQARTKANYIDN